MTVRGRRFVGLLYVALVAFATVAGVLFARAVENPEPPALFFLVELPPTEAGFAVYGGVTIAFVLGLPLAAVIVMSAVADVEEAGDRGRAADEADDADRSDGRT